MKEIAIEEASTRFAELLALVEEGEEIHLMRDGKVVVEMVLPRMARQRANADRAFASIRERAKTEGVEPLSVETILEWIHEGRR